VADRAATEPTDRSMPAETITKVTPNARMAVTAAWTPMLRRLSVVRKSPDSADMAMTRTISAVSAPLSRRRRRRPPEAPRAPAVLLSVSVATGGLLFGRSLSGVRADGECHHGVLTRLVGRELARDPALGHHAALKGLEGDVCQCPHWGYLLKGRIRMLTPEGEEFYKAGQAYYWAPGHVPVAMEDCEFVEFSPTEDFQHVIDHVVAQAG
jgi:hypothetical protein